MVDQKPGSAKGKAGRTHDELMAELSPDRRARVEARAAELLAEVEALQTGPDRRRHRIGKAAFRKS